MKKFTNNKERGRSQISVAREVRMEEPQRSTYSPYASRASRHSPPRSTYLLGGMSPRRENMSPVTIPRLQPTRVYSGEQAQREKEQFIQRMAAEKERHRSKDRDAGYATPFHQLITYRLETDKQKYVRKAIEEERNEHSTLDHRRGVFVQAEIDFQASLDTISPTKKKIKYEDQGNNRAVDFKPNDESIRSVFNVEPEYPDDNLSDCQVVLRPKPLQETHEVVQYRSDILLYV